MPFPLVVEIPPSVRIYLRDYPLENSIGVENIVRVYGEIPVVVPGIVAGLRAVGRLNLVVVYREIQVTRAATKLRDKGVPGVPFTVERGGMLAVVKINILDIRGKPGIVRLPT
jgi:hypothetical protein